MALAKAQSKSITLDLGATRSATGSVVDYALRVLSAAILGVAFIMLLYSNLGLSQIGANARAMLLACLAVIAVVLLPVLIGRPLSQRIGNPFVVPLVAVLAAVAVCVVFREAFSQGLNAYLNCIADLRCGATGMIQPKFDDGGAPAGSVMFFSVVLSAAIGALCVFATAGRRLWAAFVLPAVVLAGLAFGVVRVDSALSVFVAAVAVTLVGKCVRGGDDRAGLSKAPLLVGIGIAGLALAVAAVALTGAYRALDAGSLPEAIQSWYHKATYEPDRNPLPEGDLRNLGPLRATGRTMLSVTMEDPEPAYLRGLVRETYRDSQWQPLNASQNLAYSDLFYWLHQAGFYGQSQPAEAYKVVDPETKVATMEVSNVGACRSTVYTPYGFDQAQTRLSDDRQIGDEEVAGTPALTRWTANYVPHAVYSSYVLQQELNQNPPATEGAVSYFSNEQAYRQMVYATCLELTSDQADLLEDCLGPREVLSSTQAKIRINEFLTNNVEYRTEVGNVVGEDPTEWFLSQGHAGYSVHYASASVLMLRYFGVPARYVEGYVITREAAKQATAGEPIEVTDQNAHAWAEYYLDGVGWVPFEATPKYRSENMYALAGQAIEDPSTAQANALANQDIAEELEEPEEEQSIFQDAAEQAQNAMNDALNTISDNRMTLLFILLGSLLLLLLALIAITVYRRMRLRRFVDSFAGEDRNHAVRAAFAYAVSLIRRKVPGVDATFLRAYKDQVAGAFPSGEWFEPSLEVNECAKYSTHEISEEQRYLVKTFAGNIVEEYKQERNPLQRLFDRVVLCIY
ncbi:MAG: transglutaminase domain-containing protein [Eggerthellaceae bacterium]|nr:transglutaminase domain-containing protein [Eggerthellaceae bacterium]